MKHCLLDTSALLTLRDDEHGADRVAELLGLSGKKVCFSGCFCR
jgi:PIN domain nuclease of toxin-antitoxin system